MPLNPTSSRGGGDPPTVTAIRRPVTFDTPGLVPTTYAITAFDQPTQTITVAGDRTAAFAAGVSVVITNDGFGNTVGTVVSAAFAGGETVVILTSGVPDTATPLTANVSVGATIYTPDAGDMPLGYSDGPLTLVSVSEAWDGSTPTLRVLTESLRRAQASVFATIDATVEDSSFAGDLMLSAFPGFTVGTAWRLFRFTTADPILVTVDDNNGLDPGATQGAAEVVLLILPAA
jgi:hypothetical protein